MQNNQDLWAQVLRSKYKVGGPIVPDKIVGRRCSNLGHGVNNIWEFF